LKTIVQNKWLLLLSLVFIAFESYFVLQNKWWFGLTSLGLALVYFTLFHAEKAFMLLAFLAPISINLEVFSDGKIGLFIPTEPILLILFLLVLFWSIKKPIVAPAIFKNPILWAAAFYLFWVFITSITSTHPIVSFKFLLMRLWYFIPIFILGTHIFKNTQRIKLFYWLYMVSLCIVVFYTTINHAQYGFGEKESHWVMSPFFKDHTSYGAMCAFVLPIIVVLYFSKKHTVLMQIALISCFTIIITGLFFSYSRAAWLSIFVSFVVFLLLKFKIKFRYLAISTLILGIFVLINWTKINYTLSKNKNEHTTENFEKRVQSAANISTDASNLERINRWSCALSMFAKKPILGFGPGTYAFEYAPFQLPENKTIISTNFGNLGNAHSEFLGPLSEMGAFGILSFTLLVIAIFYKGISLYNRYPESEDKYWILALILALSSYFFHGLLNDFLDMDKVAIPVWAVVAAFMALEIKLDSKSIN
jgi:O-antigen ligase